MALLNSVTGWYCCSTVIGSQLDMHCSLVPRLPDRFNVVKIRPGTWGRGYTRNQILNVELKLTIIMELTFTRLVPRPYSNL